LKGPCRISTPPPRQDLMAAIRNERLDRRTDRSTNGSPVLRQNVAGGQVGEPSALIRRQSQLDDHPPAPPASPPPVPLRRPPPARPGEPRLAPAARGLQENDDPAETTHG